MEQIRVKTKSGKIVNRKVDEIVDYTDRRSIAYKGSTAFVICERDYDGAIWTKLY